MFIQFIIKLRLTVTKPEGQPGQCFSIPQCEKAHKHAQCISYWPVNPIGFILFILTVKATATTFILLFGNRL